MDHEPETQRQRLCTGARIGAGAFEGLDAIYRGMAPHERVRVLLRILNAPREILLSSDSIEPLQPRGRGRPPRIGLAPGRR